MYIERKLLTPNPYSRPQIKLKKITKVVVHYVGNPGSSAIGNRNYFENLRNSKKTYASSHYIVGLNGEVIQCVEENEIAYTSNSANSYSLGIECCHPLSDGKFTQLTYNSLIELLADICNRYNLNPINDILRHYDITKKLCPLWYVNHADEWEQLKVDVQDKLNKNNLGKEGINPSLPVYEAQMQNMMTKINEIASRVSRVNNSDTEKLTPIMGKPILKKEQIIAWWNKKGVIGVLNCSFEELVNIYYEIGEIEGVRADMALVQAIHETGCFRYGGVVLASQNNYAGLGACDGNLQGNANMFATPRDGCIAHIQHLKAYASVEGLKLECKDLRYHYVSPLGNSPYWEWLSIPNNPQGKGWASDENYFTKIKAIYDEIKKVVVDTANLSSPTYGIQMTPEKAIDIMVKKKIIMSPDYWLENYKNLKYLDLLLINIGNHIK